jgi:2-polyprenyl-3-methyl-5-hydroxy-6-metoxy-1,4-benzoquinol methylase
VPGDGPDAPGVFSCVADSSPDAQLAALRWFSSLTAIAGVRSEDLVLFTVGDGAPDVLDYLRAHGVTVRPVAPSASRPRSCDRIAAALSLAATGVKGLAVLTAVDAVILEDPRSVPIPAGSVGLASGGAPALPAGVPADLVAAAQLAAAQPAAPASARSRPLPAGTANRQDGAWDFLLVPGDLLTEVARAWSECAESLRGHPDATKSWEPFIAPVALAMALADSRFGLHDIDGRWNVSTEGSPGLGSRTGSPAVLKYGGRVDQKGLLRPAGSVDIDKRIAEVNAAVYRLWQQAFPSATFWEWRYRGDPELGSGVGSRGQALSEKRDLLRAVIGLLQPASVLDVGCGDGEAMRGIPIARYTGIDVSQTAVERARLGRPEGEFRVGTLSGNRADAELTLCLDVLIHQSAAQTYEDLIRTLCSGSGAILLSGLQRRPARTTAMVHFHEPLATTIKRLVPDARLYPLRKASGITTLLVLKPALPGSRGRQASFRVRLGLRRLRLRFAVLRLRRVLGTAVRQRAGRTPGPQSSRRPE